MQKFFVFTTCIFPAIFPQVCYDNPTQRSRFIRCVYNMLNSTSSAVRYDAAGVLVTLSSAPTAVKVGVAVDVAVCLCYCVYMTHLTCMCAYVCIRIHTCCTSSGLLSTDLTPYVKHHSQQQQHVYVRVDVCCCRCVFVSHSCYNPHIPNVCVHIHISTYIL